MATYMRPRLACDHCGSCANTIHFLPWVVECERVEFACNNHDPGGYWIEYDATCWDTFAHIASDKLDGHKSLAMLFTRLQEAVDFAEGLWPTKIGPQPGLLAFSTLPDFLAAGEIVEKRLIAAIPDPPKVDLA